VHSRIVTDARLRAAAIRTLLRNGIPASLVLDLLPAGRPVPFGSAPRRPSRIAVTTRHSRR
jgi:hypothetical protein